VAAAAVSLVAYGATAIALSQVYQGVSGIPAVDLVPTWADVEIVGRRVRDAARHVVPRARPGRTGA
jgi:hypothetical protein